MTQRPHRLEFGARATPARRSQRLRRARGLLLLTVLAFSSGSAGAQDAGRLTMKARALAEGRTDYIVYCQACHGSDGKGGSMAAILAKMPADLSALSAANGGVFPFWSVFAAVSGDVAVAGHDSFQMPEFWRRFQREEGLPGYAPAALRILALTHYVEGLQDAAKNGGSSPAK